jgi:3-dehydrosphinganine reductase
VRFAQQLKVLEMNNSYYANKLVLITGGSSGIGLALAKQLAIMQANVFLLARRTEVLQAALGELEKLRQTPSQKFGVLSADVANAAEIQAKLSAFIQETGAVDILINSAGVTRPGEFVEQDAEFFKWMMDINYLGTIYVTKMVVPGMVSRRSGHIINIASMAGFVGAYGYTAYCASKFAVAGFSEALRSELSIHNVKISVVYPSDVRTPQLEEENKYKPALTKALVEGNTVLMEPDDVARTILKDAAHGQYTITPGLTVRLWYLAKHITVDLSLSVMDYLVGQAKKKVEARPKQAQP